MNQKSLLAVLMTLSFATIADPALANVTDVGIARSVGIGLSAGSVPGLTLKIWVAPTATLDFGAGVGLGTMACSDRVNLCDRQASLHADYMLQSKHGPEDRVSVHLGLGARFWFWNYRQGETSLRLAARIPIGVDLYLFRWLEAYAEVVPSLAISPEVIFLEGALGARAYF